MILLLLLFAALSAIVILVGMMMDRAAIRERINGANGLPILAAIALSAAGSLILAAILGVLWGVPAALITLLLSAFWHWGALRLCMNLLQREIDRAKAPA